MKTSAARRALMLRAPSPTGCVISDATRVPPLSPRLHWPTRQATPGGKGRRHGCRSLQPFTSRGKAAHESKVQFNTFLMPSDPDEPITALFDLLVDDVRG